MAGCASIGLGAALVAAACGGQSRGQGHPADPVPQAGSTATVGGAASAGSSSTSGGGSSAGSPNTSFQLPPTGCRAMDARSNGTRCASIAGYAWNGTMCEAIQCGCSGTECERAFATSEECDRAYAGCYELAGVGRSCVHHYDCELRHRTCCPPCGRYTGDAVLAVRTDTLGLFPLGVCLSPQGGCPECESRLAPTAYAVCLEGQCTVYDAVEHASCATAQDCHLVPKDCCACGADVGPQSLLAVDATFTAPDYCMNPACDDCLPPAAQVGVRAGCHPDFGQCEVYFGSLK